MMISAISPIRAALAPAAMITKPYGDEYGMTRASAVSPTPSPLVETSPGDALRAGFVEPASESVESSSVDDDPPVFAPPP